MKQLIVLFALLSCCVGLLIMTLHMNDDSPWFWRGLYVFAAAFGTAIVWL